MSCKRLWLFPDIKAIRQERKEFILGKEADRQLYWEVKKLSDAADVTKELQQVSRLSVDHFSFVTHVYL